MRKTISTYTLQGTQYEACSLHTELFGDLFGWGKSVPITPKNVRKARLARINITWFLLVGLSYKDCERYNQLRMRRFTQIFVGGPPSRSEMDENEKWCNYIDRLNARYLKKCR